MSLARHSSIATLAGAALALVVASSARAQVEHRTLSGDRPAIFNLAGSLRVQATTGAQVVVDITKAGRDADKLQVASGTIHGVEALRVIYPSDRIVYPRMRMGSRTQMRVSSDGTFDNPDGDWYERNRVEIRDSGSGLEAFANIVVSVPKGRSVDLHWGVGDATISNVDGDILLSVAAATVTTEHTRGRLDLDTGSGLVRVTDAQGDLNIDSGSGGVTLDSVRGSSLRIDAGSGRVRADNIDVASIDADVGSGGLSVARLKSTRIRADVGSGALDLDLLSVVENLSIDAGSGGVTVRLPASQGAELDIETGSGGIESDFAVRTTHLERNNLRGQIGDGRGRIKIESGSGRVRLIKN